MNLFNFLKQCSIRLMVQFHGALSNCKQYPTNIKVSKYEIQIVKIRAEYGQTSETGIWRN